jgi:hypothetical protein
MAWSLLFPAMSRIDRGIAVALGRLFRRLLLGLSLFAAATCEALLLRPVMRTRLQFVRPALVAVEVKDFLGIARRHVANLAFRLGRRKRAVFFGRLRGEN